MTRKRDREIRMTIELLDTHQHLVLTDRLTYQWPNNIDALRGRAFTYADYLEASAGTSVADTLFMEADADDWREETEIVLDMVADPGTMIRGVIANCRPEQEDGFDAWLERVANSDVVGLRRILHETTDDVSQTSVFRSNLKKLAAHGLTFDINYLARQLPIAADLLREVETVQFTLDHCGVPDIASGDIEDWRGHIKTLAGFPNLACKISGVTAYCAPGKATLETLRPIVEHCIESFGWDRVVWGSDWPVCNINSSVSEWTAITKAIVRDEDPAHQQKLFRDNALRLYKPRRAAR
jgi:predicted TIM-barrel fold metal-dependent hydrolase